MDFQTSTCRYLCLIGVFCTPLTARPHDRYVSPAGSASGSGTLAEPWDLGTALSGAVGAPGDVFWLKRGHYFIGHINTKIHGEPGRPITFRSMPGEMASVDGSLTSFESAGYVVLRDFELYSSNTNRASAQTKAGFKPTDIKNINGISSFSPNMSFINLAVHDETGEGIYISQAASNNLVYGCVVFNNGWRAPDNAEGHGIYVQGSDGGRMIADNIVFNNSGAGLHIYDDDTNEHLGGITLDGNTVFHAGAIQNVRFYRDWIVGVDAPATSADSIVFENNMGYRSLTRDEDNTAQIGRQGTNGWVEVLDNYLPQGLEMNNWTHATVTGNVIGTGPAKKTVTLNQAKVRLTAAWDENTYLVRSASSGFARNKTELGFSDWKNATGFDSNSICQSRPPTDIKVFIRTNIYEPARANIIVYNWGKAAQVTVDVSSILPLNTPYEVRNAEDFLGGPVLSGTYNDSKPLCLPMKGLTVAVPNGPMLTPPPTGPEFNVFVLTPRFASQVTAQRKT